jgi:ribosomal protein S18
MVPHLFSPIFAFGAESNSHITTLRFNVQETVLCQHKIKFSEFQKLSLLSTYLTERTLIFHRMY